MSRMIYNLGGLRLWTQDEIELREMFAERAASVVKSTLRGINPAWGFARIEGPCLCPTAAINLAYSPDDVFVTNHKAGGDSLALRAETTASSYEYARLLKPRLPFCVYQSGKSFRRETNDGASASKLRFNEFHQLEFQCIYAVGTKADYRTPLIEAVAAEIGRFTRLETAVAASDRLPSYSTSTVDILVEWKRTTEIASCSLRTDFSTDAVVCEIAIGLDRLAHIAGEKP